MILAGEGKVTVFVDIENLQALRERSRDVQVFSSTKDIEDGEELVKVELDLGCFDFKMSPDDKSVVIIKKEEDKETIEEVVERFIQESEEGDEAAVNQSLYAILARKDCKTSHMVELFTAVKKTQPSIILQRLQCIELALAKIK